MEGSRAPRLTEPFCGLRLLVVDHLKEPGTKCSVAAVRSSRCTCRVQWSCFSTATATGASQGADADKQALGLAEIDQQALAIQADGPVGIKLLLHAI